MVDIDLISVMGVELDLSSVAGSEWTCFFRGGRKILGFFKCLDRNSLGFCVRDRI